MRFLVQWRPVAPRGVVNLPEGSIIIEARHEVNERGADQVIAVLAQIPEKD